jgi:hypothetical protein
MMVGLGVEFSQMCVVGDLQRGIDEAEAISGSQPA